MSLPLFYSVNLETSSSEIMLDENNSRHVIQVLRMNEQEQIALTNGKGLIAECIISSANKKSTLLQIQSVKELSPISPHVTIAISPIKNSNRFEWFLEKATEIGVNKIVLLHCKRTEKTHFKTERIQGILISAMLQSQQAWVPEFVPLTNICEYISSCSGKNKFIAHCGEGSKKVLTAEPMTNDERIILVGPEGDFTADEIESAITSGFNPVTLGATRLRTETAGIVAATLLKSISVAE